jgi:hypothetical protein
VVAIPLWFKLAYTGATLVILVVWLRHYGPRNLLWFSDVALLGAVPALWLDQALLASVLAVATLLPEVLWNVDFALRLLLRRRVTGLTEYMFERDRLLRLRLLSLFHVPLPLVLLWMVAAYGYDPRGLAGALLLAVVVLPASRLAGTPRENINWTHGLGGRPSTWPAVIYVPLLWAGFAVAVFLPTHLLLQRFGS